jgi:hypothetical protein
MNVFSSDRRVLWLLFVLALALRLIGLSHDLHFETVYHPDTPKQMRAVQQFLNDDYLVFQGHSDYDGYPYFNSHVVEYVVRCVMAVETVWLKWIGAWTGPVEPPGYLTLFWITRVMNALISAVAVPLLFLIGLRFSRRAAWMASVFLLLSPLDISAAHFASNDSTVALFCLLALWFGFRVAERGQWRDLAGGAFCVAAAFSTKYHGAMAFLPVLIGHVLFCRSAGGLFSSAALARWAFLALVGLIGIFLTSPALIVNLEPAVNSILHFFQYTANFNMSEEFKALPAYHRFWIGLRENIPVIIDAVSLPVALTFLVGLVAWIRDPRIALLVSVPVLHLVVGLSGKPYLHQAHHTPITAYVFLTAAVVWAGMSFRGSGMVWMRRVGVVLAVWTAGHLSVFSAREVMSFYVSDTRRVAETWMLDSVPKGVQWLTWRYTVTLPEYEGPKLPVYASAQSGDQPHRVPGMIPWTQFAFFDNRFSKFINRVIHLHTLENEYFRLPSHPPYLLPLSGERRDTALSLDAPWFGRSSRVRNVAPDLPVRVWAVSTQRVERAWLVVQTGDRPVLMTTGLGGRAERVHLPAGRYHVVPVQNPRRFYLPGDIRYYYRWYADVVWGAARVTLMTDGAELARWAMAHQDREWMTHGLAHTREESLVVDVMRALTEPFDPVVRAELRDRCQRLLDEPAAWKELLGVSEEWLSLIPYWRADHTAWDAIEPDEALGQWAIGPIMLDPGSYRWRCALPSGGAHDYTVTDGAGRLLQRGVIDAGSDEPLVVGAPGDPLTITIDGLAAAPIEITVRPDARAMITTWIHQLGEDRVWGATRPASGDSTPLATFDASIHLIQANVDKGKATPGGHLDVLLVWWTTESVTRPDRHSIWIHVVNENGMMVAQYDQGLSSYLREIRPDPRGPPLMDRIALPDSIPPGRYEVRVGVWIPSQRNRSDVTSASLPHTRRFVVIDTIDVSALR